MVYRKTPYVLAQMAKRRAAMLRAAVQLADRGGLASLNVNEVAQRAHVAIGTLYLHFADRDELIAAIAACRLEQDIAAMTIQTPDPLLDLVTSIEVFIHRFSATRHLGPSLAALPAYRAGIVAELARKIGILMQSGRIARGDASMLATALYGALNAVLVTRPQIDDKTRRALVAMTLRLVGVVAQPDRALAPAGA
jgi:AcrR family transcriptional regulator